ncbi:serine O-acetyltransferase [Gryllotalpicola ginsengisoli]|uniref:serine O-acetyltransferase n=1 Tax=Gryllotalpicola ginsengisoli TaxID=444608 RepID=UPI0003B70F44|nr:serine O-acetyltransferase [Gryllotalpicola ginsengisoli]
MPAHPLRALREDVAAVKRRDPAARSTAEILLAYSGMHAVWAYRVAHRWWLSPGLKLPARLLSQFARARTGVEIHPGARIGRRLVIDHGMSVVIGETAVIGNDVLIYHGVTLGGKERRGDAKRHPTVGDDVVIGAGAKLIGDISIGAHSVVGANAVVTKDFPEHSVLTGVPAENRARRG